MKNSLKIILIAALFLAASACSVREDSFRTDLGVGEFSAIVEKGGVTLLDVRTPQEFGEGHIPGALNVDYLASEEDFTARFKAACASEDPVAVYCRSGRRSAAASDSLRAAGYSVYNLEGGFNAWKAAGLAVE